MRAGRPGRSRPAVLLGLAFIVHSSPVRIEQQRRERGGVPPGFDLAKAAVSRQLVFRHREPHPEPRVSSHTRLRKATLTGSCLMLFTRFERPARRCTAKMR
jgi:hypothetical protein